MNVVAPFAYHEDLTVDNEGFSSWQDLFGPHHSYGDNFTSLLRYNLSDPYSTGQPLYGYQNVSHPHAQVLTSDDVVLFTDGTCSSTCTIFAEFLKTQGQVRQIVVGGRKQNAPMQAIGGTKGAEDAMFGEIVETFTAAYELVSPIMKARSQQIYGGLDGWFVNATLQALSRISEGPLGQHGTFNLRNNIRKGDSTETPLQFVYEAAVCRFFYTAEMYTDQELVWNTVYNLAWGNGTCVPGSTGQVSSKPGVGCILSPPPPASAHNLFKSNVTSVYPSAELGNGSAIVAQRHSGC